MSRFASRAGVAKGKGDGFWSGTAVGASLGLLYAPCAGPILAGVITVSASQSFSAGRLAVALSYGIGSAVVLYFLMLGGRRVVRAAGPARRRPADRDGSGDGRRRPGDARQLRHPLPEHDRQRPAELPRQPDRRASRTPPRRKSALADPRRLRPRRSAPGDRARLRRRGAEGQAATCRYYGEAPEFVDNQRWFNTPGDRPLTLRRLRGRVVLVDFWTYSCINCIRTLPYLNAWDSATARTG